MWNVVAFSFPSQAPSPTTYPSSLPTLLHSVTLHPLHILSELCLLLQENIIPAAFHDGLLLYIQAVNETLAQGGTVADGENITQRMWNRSFQGQGLELPSWVSQVSQNSAC